MVLFKLNRKAHFIHASQYTYCIVHGQSQQETFSHSAHGMIELGIWINITSLGGRGGWTQAWWWDWKKSSSRPK